MISVCLYDRNNALLLSFIWLFVFTLHIASKSTIKQIGVFRAKMYL